MESLSCFTQPFPLVKLLSRSIHCKETCPGSAGPSAAAWRRCGTVGWAYQGPIREVFGAPWVVVIPDEPTKLSCDGWVVGEMVMNGRSSWIHKIQLLINHIKVTNNNGFTDPLILT